MLFLWQFSCYFCFYYYMKVDPVELSKQVRKVLETNIEKSSLKKVVPKIDCEASECQGILGKAQLALQKATQLGAKTDAEIDVILCKIAKEHEMVLGRHVGDNHIVIGKPFEGFPNLCDEKMRARCLRNAQGFLDEVYVSDVLNKDVFVYDAKGVLKKHFTGEDMKALKEYKYHPREIHAYLRDGKVTGFQTKDELLKCVETIRNIFNDETKVWRTNEPITVYRALQSRLNPEQIEAISKKGGILKEPSFVSTSLDLNVAKRFAHNSPILEIELPKGAKYIDLDLLFNIDSTHWREKEFLLENGSEFFMTGANSAKALL